MTKQELNSDFEKLEANIKWYLRQRIYESNIESVTHQIKIIPVNLFDYIELGIINYRLTFLCKDGYHYSLLGEADLHDLIDIVNQLEDGLPDLINDELNNTPDNFKVTKINKARCGHIEYFWKSPSVKGDKFYGWVKCS